MEVFEAMFVDVMVVELTSEARILLPSAIFEQLLCLQR